VHTYAVGDLVHPDCKGCPNEGDSVNCRGTPRPFRVILTSTSLSFTKVFWGEGPTQYCPSYQVRLARQLKVVGNELILEDV